MGFLKGFSIVMVANLILLALTFLNNKLLYICLDKENNGLFFLIVRFSLLISFFSSDWLRLSNMNIAGRDKSLSKTLIANTIWYCIILGITLVPFLYFLTPLLAKLFPGIPWLYILAAVGVAIILIIRDSSLVLLLVSQKPMSYGLTQIVGGSLFLLLNLLFLTVFHMGLQAVLFAWAIGGMAGMLWAVFSHMAVHGYSLRPSWSVFNQSRKLGIRSWIAVIGMFLMINIHAFVIGPMLGDPVKTFTMLAVFSVCFRVFQVLQRFADVTSGFLLSNVVRHDRESGSWMTVLTTRNVMLFSLVTSATAILLGKGLISFISSSQYMAAYIPLLIMFPGMIAINSGSVLNGFFWAHGYHMRVILSPFAAAGLAVILDFLLIDRMGVSGIALSFTLASLCWMLYISLYFKKISGTGLIELYAPRFSDIAYVFAGLKKAFLRSPT
jgi:O-antigen/teichoic acid export membrane protein